MLCEGQYEACVMAYELIPKVTLPDDSWESTRSLESAIGHNPVARVSKALNRTVFFLLQKTFGQIQWLCLVFQKSESM